MTIIRTPAAAIGFFVTSTQCTLFEDASAEMTRELRTADHARPEGFAAIGDRTAAHAIFAHRGLVVIGMVAVCYDAIRRSGSIHRLWVAPSARGCGVGRALMTQAEHSVAGAGGHEIELETGADLGAAVALYRGMGYCESPGTGPAGLRFRKRTISSPQEHPT